MLLLLFACLSAFAAPPAQQIKLSKDGWFRNTRGELWVPLGGFHANVLPLSRLNLTAEERAKVAYIWSGQKTDDQGHVDLRDASDAMLDRWFKTLAADGVTALRLFARARVGNDVLDLCGKLNPELKQVFHRAFAAARPYGIRFQLQILPEPGSMCYLNRRSIAERVLPRYSKEELAALTPAQKRFLVDGKRLTLAELFTDQDALACQKLYLAQALDWIATEPQVFALEIYNEQGWTRAPFDGKYDYTYTFPYEDAEIRWSAELIRTIKQRLPNMLVTLSHPGFGITGYDPFKWSRPAGVDFYSPHLYAGLGGDSSSIDFAAVTAASALIINAGVPNFYGEWDIFSSPVPMELRRFSHRDAVWLSLLSGQPGFFQWTYEFPDEYRWPGKVFSRLPKKFSPARPKVEVEIGEVYRTFQDNTRYPAFVPGKLFPGFPFNRQKQNDENLQKMFRAYQRSLDIGVPIAFTMDRKGAMSLEDFVAADAAKFQRPIQAIGGYQLTWLKDAKSPLWLAYLRKRRIETYKSHHVGVPEEAPLEVRFDLPKGRYRVRLIDLTADRDETRSISSTDSLKLSEKTNHDYVMVVSR